MLWRVLKELKKQKGIAIMELIIAVAVTGVLAMGASMAAIQVMKNTRTGGDQVDMIRDVLGRENGVLSTIQIVQPDRLTSDENASIYDYAIIALDGDITMTGNAWVKSDPLSPYEGDVYASNDIKLTGNPEIKGEATAGGTITKTGNAKIYKETQGTLNFDLIPEQTMIDEADSGFIDTAPYLTQAQAGKQKSSGYTVSSGSVTLGTGSSSYSYINGNLNIQNNATVTLNGTLWVNGYITVSGNSTLKGVGTIVSGSLSGASKNITISGNAVLTANGGDLVLIVKKGNYSSTGNNKVDAKIYVQNGNMTLNGNSSSSLTLWQQHITGNLTITANYPVQLHGTIWVNGAISITGNTGIYGPGTIGAAGAITATGNATLLPDNIPLIVSTSTSNQAIKTTGNSTMSGILYAPYGDIQMTGNSSIFGSVIGKSLKNTGNNNITYPVVLRDR